MWPGANRQRRTAVFAAARKDGSFRILIDPKVAVRVDAGWKNYPIGTASATLHGKPDGELVLRPQ